MPQVGFRDTGDRALLRFRNLTSDFFLKSCAENDFGTKEHLTHLIKYIHGKQGFASAPPAP